MLIGKRENVYYLWERSHPHWLTERKQKPAVTITGVMGDRNGYLPLYSNCYFVLSFDSFKSFKYK